MQQAQRRFYTRRHTPFSWHVKHAVWTMLTGGLWGFGWWLAYRARRRPMTETYEVPVI